MKIDKTNLTSNQKERINNIDYVVGGIALLGAIGGVVYAKKTGGGFWRYVGYWIAGGLVVGVPARLVALPFKNKILKEGDKTPIVKVVKENDSKEASVIEPSKKEALEKLQNMPIFNMK